jgi:starch synthase
LIILSHSGKQHSYQVAKAMYNLGSLERFYTSSYITSPFMQRLLGKRPGNFWSRRFIAGLPGKLVEANWHFEIPEMVLRKIQGKSPAVQRAVYKRDTKFDNFVAEKLVNHDLTEGAGTHLFWGFQGSCHASLRSAKELGWESICELTTAHVVAAKQLLGEEARLHPEWAGSIDNLVFPADYEKRLEEEPHQAKHVVVASSFSRNSLMDAGVPRKKIFMLPLGFEPAAISFSEKGIVPLDTRPLKLLFAGTVTQRKGIKYLLEAMKMLKPGKDVELHLIGGIQGPEEPLKQYREFYTYHGAVSQTELFSRFGDYDALVLPTIFEGFGLVILEAMAAGLPVITTPNSIGPEIITEGKNGFIVPIRDVEGLIKSIELLRGKSNEEFIEMRRSANAAAMNFSWENYTKKLSIFLNGIG